MSGFREYPGAFDEEIDSPPTERQHQRRASNRNGRGQTISREDFYAYMPTHKYIFVPSGQLWPAISVNARLGSVGSIAANVWLDQNRPVEQMTWALVSRC